MSRITDASPAKKYGLLVAGGTYGGATVEMRQHVDMYGGFEGVAWTRDLERYPTVLDGENGRSVIVGASNARLDGFVVTRGNTEHSGGGMYCYSSSPSITNNVFSGNSAYSGGGICCTMSSSPAITNNVFIDNSASQGGGVLCDYSSSPAITNNMFSGNSADYPYSGGGGGLCCFRSSSPTVTNNIFNGNWAKYSGGGVYCDSSSPAAITNCIVRSNGSQISGLSAGLVTYSNIEGSGFPDPSNIDRDSLFVGRLAGGLASSLSWDSASCRTALADSSGSLVPDSLRGSVVTVGTRRWYCLSNTATQIVLVGDATVGGAVMAPARWEVYDYHLKPDSPCRNAGVGPALNSSVPLADIDGDARSGSACDMGVDQYSAATAPATTGWGRLWVTSAASSAVLDHVTIDNGAGTICETANTVVRNSKFSGCLGDGLSITSGSSDIVGTSATFNGGAGINAPRRPLRDCFGASNGSGGLSGTLLTSCTATTNAGIGLAGTGAVDCSAGFNGGDGVSLSGSATNCTARDNRGKGIVLTAGNATGCAATLNTGVGIQISGGGTVSGCSSVSNAGGGIVTNGSRVTSCTSEANTGVGITGAGSSVVIGSRVINNSGAAMSGVATVTDCAVAANGSGISGASTVTGTFSGGGAGAGVSATTVRNCSIVGNTGHGASGPSAIANSHLVFNGGNGIEAYSSALGTVDRANISGNGGMGIRSANGVGSVTKSAVLANGDMGVVNILSLGGSNIWGNGNFDARDDVRGAGSALRAFWGNYWGAEHNAVLAAFDDASTTSPPVNVPFIWDFFDGGEHMVKAWPPAPGLLAAGPDDTPPAFLLDAKPDTRDARGVGETTFTLVFSKAMDVSVAPSVTFGLKDPYDDHVVQPNPGWHDPRTWQGRFWVQSDTGEGTQTLRVSSARAADGFALPDDMIHRFVIDTDSGLSANNGLASAITPNSILVQWDEDTQPVRTSDLAPEATLGYNVTRQTSSTKGFVQVNDARVTEPYFLDTTVPPDAATVSYKVEVVRTGSNSNQWSPVLDPYSGSYSLPREGNADLRVSVAFPANPPRVGQEFALTFTVTNDGPDAAGTPIFECVFPFEPLVRIAGVATTAGSVDHAADGMARVLLPSDFGAGASALVTVRLVVNSPFVLKTCGVVRTLLQSDANPRNNIAACSVEVRSTDARADLGLTMNAPAAIVRRGQTANYTVSVRNLGPGPCDDAVVTDTLPAGASLVSAVASRGTTEVLGGSTLVWRVGSLPVGATMPSMEVVVLPTSEGSAVNAATVAASAPDPVSTNNSASASVSVEPSTDVWVGVSDAPDPVLVGQILTYSLVAGNAGPSVAEGVVLRDVLPAGTTFVSSDPPPFGSGGQTRTWQLGTLPGGSGTTVTVRVRPAQAGNLVNLVSISSSPNNDLNQANNTANVNTTAEPAADVSVTKLVLGPAILDEPLTYTLVVANAGPSPAPVVLTDYLPARAEYVWSDREPVETSGTTPTWNLGTMAKGSATTVTLVVRPREVGRMVNTASVQAAASDPDANNNTALAETVVAAKADLSLVKTVGAGPALLNAPLTYTLVVTNHGPSEATSVVLTDFLTAAQSYVLADPPVTRLDEETSACLWQLGALPPGAATTVTLVAIPRQVGAIVNTAEVAAAERDPVPGNNRSFAPVVVSALADRAVAVVPSRGAVPVDTPLSLTLVASNAGPCPAASVVVTEVLPAGAEFVGCDPPASSQAGAILRWEYPTLAVGQAANAVVTIRPKTPGTLMNQAYIGAGTSDPVPSNNYSETTVSVFASADVRVLASGMPPTVALDEPATFTVAVSNFGPSDAVDVVLSDTLGAALAFQNSWPPPASNGQGGALKWNLGTLAKGAMTTVTVTALPTAVGDLTNEAQVWAATHDPETLNNISVATVRAIRVADLRVGHWSSPNPAVAGLPFGLVAETSDTLGAGATDACLALDWPSGLAVSEVSASMGTVTSDSLGRVSVTLDSFPGGGKVTLVTTATASAPGSYPTVASVICSEPERTPDDTSATVWTLVEPAFRVARDDGFSTGAVSDGTVAGWIRFGMNSDSLGWPSYFQDGHSYLAVVKADASGAHFRNTGVVASQADWLPYALVGNDRYVRAKFMMYAGGQSNPADQNQVPNFRLRLSNRFAVNSMLEVFNHEPGDSAETRAMYAELRPSTVAGSPSVYRVDMDPVDVPYLVSNSGFEGVQRGFEAYAIHPTDQGYVAMTESVIGTYPLALTPPTAPAAKVYAPDSAGAGDLAVYAVPATAELTLTKLIPSAEEGGFAAEDATTAGLPTHAAGPRGVTLDTMAVATDRIGVATRNFNPDRGTNDFAHHVRVAEGKQYVVRFHLTSTQQVNRQAQIRLRGRSVKFGWSQKFELGGAWGTGGGATYPLNQNNSIAQQALPGVGCENPDRSPTDEPGGWYTMIMHTPLSADIRPEFAAGTPLAARMPGITAQPGPGVNAASRRDLLFGMDLVDTLSAGAGRFLEQGNVTLDRIDVRVFDLVPD